MSGGPDPLYVRARNALLDAADALTAQLDAVYQHHLARERYVVAALRAACRPGGRRSQWSPSSGGGTILGSSA